MSRKPLTLLLTSVLLISLLAWAVPTFFIGARHTPASILCANNLRRIEGAKEQWALENKKTTNDTPNWEDISAYFGPNESRKNIQCPLGGTYFLGRVAEPPRCSIGKRDHSQRNNYFNGDARDVVLGSLTLLSCLGLFIVWIWPRKPVDNP